MGLMAQEKVLGFSLRLIGFSRVKGEAGTGSIPRQISTMCNAHRQEAEVSLSGDRRPVVSSGDTRYLLNTHQVSGACSY